jgi:hypothetical protein
MSYTPDERRPPPGQQAILNSFKKHGRDSIYQASDVLDLRVCCAMVERGFLSAMGEAQYELTAAGAKAAGFTDAP